MRPRGRYGLPILLLALATMMLAAPVAAEETGPEDAPATALRVALGRALGEHAFLLGEVIRSGIANNPDFDAAADALGANTDDIVAAIDSVYGAEAAAAFDEQWRNHVAYIVDYGRALGDGDEAAAELATEQLDRYVTDFSGFLADALPALPPDAVEGLIGEHVQQLEHVASFDEADIAGAYAAISETYAHMFAIGDGLALGIISLFPDRFEGQEAAFSPATDVRQTLDRLLGEHTYFAALAMRSVLRDDPNSSAAADALAANTSELGETIADVYGDEVGAAFTDLWESHVAAYFAYVTALGDDDMPGTDAALEDLLEYRTNFSAYVAEANPFLSIEALEALIADHTDHLVAQADAYAEGDYDGSYELGREAYAHAGTLSASLAAAIADQFPQRFPDASMTKDPGMPSNGIGVALVVVAVVLGAWRYRRQPEVAIRPGT